MITEAEWLMKRAQGYAQIKDGQCQILALDPASGATVLEPVRIVTNCDARTLVSLERAERQINDYINREGI